MSDAQLTRLMGRPVVNEACGRARVHNHRWDLPGTFAETGTIPADEVASISGGLLSEPIRIKINKLLFDYDHVLICGPVFPHEVVGFREEINIYSPVSAPERRSPTLIGWAHCTVLQHNRHRRHSIAR